MTHWTVSQGQHSTKRKPHVQRVQDAHGIEQRGIAAAAGRDLAVQQLHGSAAVERGFTGARAAGLVADVSVGERQDAVAQQAEALDGAEREAERIGPAVVGERQEAELLVVCVFSGGEGGQIGTKPYIEQTRASECHTKLTAVCKRAAGMVLRSGCLWERVHSCRNCLDSQG